MRTRELVFAALTIGLVTLGARLQITIAPVSFTLQPLMVMSCSLLLPKRSVIFGLLSYLLIGFLGLPVFSTGGGIAYLFRPSAGFLFGFVAMALWIVRWRKSGAWLWNLLVCVSADMVLYLVALPIAWVAFRMLGTSLSPWLFLRSMCLIFLPGDLLSALLATSVSQTLRRYTKAQ